MRDRERESRREWRERMRAERRNARYEWRHWRDDWHDDDRWRYHRHWHKLGHGVSLLVIGCVLIAVGLSLGGHWNGIPWWPWTNGANAIHGWTDGNAGKGASSAAGTEEKSGTIAASVKRIDIRLKASSLVIRSGAAAGSGTYSAKGFGKNALHISSDNGSIRIEEGEWEHLLDFGNDTRRPAIEIELPTGLSLDSCSVHVGAGSAAFENISADDFDVDSGAGSIKGRSITAKNVTVEAGAGSIDLAQCAFEETKVSTGAGSFSFDGSLGKRTEVSSGAGPIDMSVKGKKDDYRIDYSRGVGSVRVAGESYNGMGNGTAGNGNADHRIKVSSGVGSVKIDFTE